MLNVVLALLLQVNPTPFGTVYSPPEISADVASYIATLIYGADARTVTNVNSGSAPPSVQVCIGVQQYQPSVIQTPIGPLANVHAGQPAQINWIACGLKWNDVVRQVIKQAISIK